MKRIFTFLLLLIGLCGLRAEAQEQMFTFDFKEDKVSIEEYFAAIEQQSKYLFAYADTNISGVRVKAISGPIGFNALMNYLISGTSLKYDVFRNTVTISEDKSKRPVIQEEPQKTIGGRIVDEKGDPIIGAWLLIKGTQKGTTTDIYGRWTFDEAAGKTLVASALGFLDYEFQPNEGDRNDITMKEDRLLLDEVVVIGYSVVKKRDLTSSISKVTTDKLEHLPSTSITNSIQGQAAGVLITPTSGRPGAGMQVRIRGVGTVNNNDPLYLVDGTPVSSIDYLNANEIASIEILKDASSAAIYGTRAANGVVMVTTKSGSGASQKPVITFDGYVGFSNPVKGLTPAGADEYLAIAEEVYGNKSAVYKKVVKEYEKGYDTNWWEAINRKNALLQNYSLSVEGKAGKLSYFLSGTYVDQEGIDRRSSYDKISLRLNTEYELKDWLVLGENLSISNENVKGGFDSGKSGFVAASLRTDPLFPITNPDLNDDNAFNNYGTSSLSNFKNPYAEQDRYINTRNNNASFRVQGNAYARLLFLKKTLVFNTNVGLEILNNDQSSFTPIYYLNVEDHNDEAQAWRYFSKSSSINWLNTLSYNNTFGKHSINGILGFQMEVNKSDFLSGLKLGQPNNSSNFQWVGAGIMGDEVGGIGSESAMLSYFARANYSFDDRYLLSASVRADGSSNFGPGRRWGVFPAVSGAWKISNEKFFKNCPELSFITNLKLRAGWGQLGNQRISNMAFSTYVGTSWDREFVFQGTTVLAGYGPSNAGNPNVSWEKTESFDIGLDANFFDDRLGFTADFYVKNTRDMLIQIPISPIFGTYSPWENIGAVKNTGFEFAIDWRDRVGKFDYSVGFNFTTNKNKVVSLGGALPYVDSGGGNYTVTGYCRTVENMPIGYFYGYRTDGIFQTPAEVASYTNKDGELLQPYADPGDFRFVDTNKDGVIDDYDKTFIGSPHPDFYYGINLSCSYYGVSLNVILNGVQGNEIFNAFKEYCYKPVGYQNLLAGTLEKSWSPGSGINDYPILKNIDKNDNYRASDFYIEDGSFLKVKSIELGYTFPRKWCEKIHFTPRIWVALNNILTITKYSGLDPELASGWDRATGVDIGNYPQCKSIQMGINIKF